MAASFFAVCFPGKDMIQRANACEAPPTCEGVTIMDNAAP